LWQTHKPQGDGRITLGSSKCAQTRNERYLGFLCIPPSEFARLRALSERKEYIESP
jgi:hypothetical protein